MPYLIFLFVCSVWSVSFILMKKAALAFSPAEIAMWRVVAGSATLGLLWLWRDRAWTLRRGDVGPLFIAVVGGCAWPYFIQPWIISRQGSAFMALMVSFVPLLTILVSLPVLRVAPSGRQLVGVIGSLVCMGVLMRDGLTRQVPWQNMALALTVPLGYSITNVAIRRRLSHAGSLLVTLVAFGASAVVLTPVAALSRGDLWAESDQRWLASWSLAFLGIIGTGVATFLFNKLVREQGPLFAGMTTNLVPLGAVLFGWLDAEQVTWSQGLALAGIVAMVTLVQFRAAGSSPPPSSVAPTSSERTNVA